MIKSSHSQNSPGSIKPKLKGVEGYRLRVGKYRILYDIDDHVKTVTIHRVQHRKEVYR
jgi:mRNA interferase RelE/StbE